MGAGRISVVAVCVCAEHQTLACFASIPYFFCQLFDNYEMSPGPGSRVVHVGGSEISVLLVGRGYYVLKSPYAIPTGVPVSFVHCVPDLEVKTSSGKRGILRLNDRYKPPIYMNQLKFYDRLLLYLMKVREMLLRPSW